MILFRRLIHRLKYQNAICFLYAIRNSIWDSIFLYNSKKCCNSDPIDLQYMYMHVQCLLFFICKEYCWHIIYCHFQQNFSYIVAVSFIGGGNRSTQWKPPTCRKSLTNFITDKLYHWHNALLSTPPHERSSNSQLKWWWATITQVVVNLTTIRPWRPQFS